MNEKTLKLISQLTENWDAIKAKQVIKEEIYGSGREVVGGKLWWDNPNLIFVLVTDEEEGYEGSQAQIGVSKDGKLRWEYQSHCSCDDYADSTDLGEEFLPELSKKSYELSSIPLDWENLIQENITKLLECIK